jgi:hypothetical protein
VVTDGVPSVAASMQLHWLRSELLEPLAGRFARQGYPPEFDQGFETWLADELRQSGGSQGYLDTSVTPLLAAGLPRHQAQCARPLSTASRPSSRSAGMRPLPAAIRLLRDMTTPLARRPEDAWFSRISAQNG